MGESDDMLVALEDTTTAVIAHGLLNSMAVLAGTATAMLQNWDKVAADPEQARQMLERIERHARLASGVLEDLVRGLPPDVASTLASIDRR
jgi:Tfp pilus assembly protein PilN